MATSYPAGLDSYTNPTASDELDDEVGTRTHSEFHADNNDAIEAIQAKLGTTTTPATFSVGSAAAPAITFIGDSNTGVFQSAADAVGIAAGGTERLTVGTTAATFTVPASWTQANGVETRALSVQPYGTGKAPYVWSVINIDHAGTPDPNLFIGYNQKANGALINAGEPGLSWALEADYNDGSGDNKMEAYLQFVDPDATVALRPFFFQFNRDTDALSSAVIMGTATGGVDITSDDGTALGTTVAQFVKNDHTFIGAAGANNVVSVTAAAGQAAALDLGYDGTETVMRLIPTSSTAGSLVVSSTVVMTATAAAVTFPVKVVLPVGAVNAPSLYFSGDGSSGLYSPTSGTVVLTSGGVAKAQVSSAGLMARGSSSTLADAFHVRNEDTTGTNSVGIVFDVCTSVASSYYQAAKIVAVKEDVYTSGSAGTYDGGLRFSTVLNTAYVEALALSAAGNATFSGTIKANGAAGAAVADASGGATVDAEARTAINALLARIRTIGLIAT